MPLSALGSAEMRALGGCPAWQGAVLMSGFLDIRRRSRYLGRREPMVDGPQDGLRPGRDAYLAVGAANVGLDGVDAHDQGAGDLVVAPARGDEPEHVPRPRSETNFAAGIAA